MSPLSLRSPSGTEIIRTRLLKRLHECMAAQPQSAADLGGISAENLAQALGLSSQEQKPQAVLSWPGKREALQKALEPCLKTFQPRPELSWGSFSENLYLEGDNLEVLKLLGLSYNCAVKVIYIDPPYNTGKDFVYNDSFVQDEEVYASDTGYRSNDELKLRLRSNKETDGRYHSNWCSLIYPRLLLARQLLRDDGVIFISIDDYEQHNLKLICDEIFGAANLVTQLVWQRAYSPKNDAKFVSTSHDYVLMYAYDKAAFDQALSAQGLSCDFGQGQLLKYDQVGHSQEGTQELKELLHEGVFDGPKPVRLIKHLLNLSGLKADGRELVLDFFSGSATTAQAVMELNAADGGTRRFIMVQLPEACNEKKRATHDFATICDIGRARIRAVAEKIATQLNWALPPLNLHRNSAGGGCCDDVNLSSDPITKPFAQDIISAQNGANALLETSLDLGLQVLALEQLPPLEARQLSLAELQAHAQAHQGELLAPAPIDQNNLEYQAPAWLYCVAAQLKLPLHLTISIKLVAGFKVWCYGPDLLWLCPQGNLALSQAWLDALGQEPTWPQYLALRARVLRKYQDTEFLLGELFKAITLVPLTSEEGA